MIPLVLLALSFARAEEGTATVPVSELLALHAAKSVAPTPPPVAGALDRIALEARIVDREVRVKAQVEVSVLPTQGWSKVPILHLQPSTRVQSIPVLADAWLVVEGRELVLVTDKPGRRSFSLEWSERATARGQDRLATLSLAASTSSHLALSFDETLVSLADEQSTDLAAPMDGAYRLAWRAREASQAVVAQKKVPKDPAVERAYASVVSTLEGTRVTRVHYELAFEGPQSIRFDVPTGQALDRASVAGVAVPVPESGPLELSVLPDQAGGDVVVVELVLFDRTEYALAGTLELQMPKVSWPTRTWVLTCHLPEVFETTWRGGSMRPETKVIPEPDFLHAIPTPGTTTTWTQELVTANAPTLRLDYDVDLTGSYFQLGHEVPSYVPETSTELIR